MMDATITLISSGHDGAVRCSEGLAVSSYFENVKALYGAREAERTKRVLRFGTTKITLCKRNDIGSPSWDSLNKVP
jgi:hypothetical protein